MGAMRRHESLEPEILAELRKISELLTRLVALDGQAERGVLSHDDSEIRIEGLSTLWHTSDHTWPGGTIEVESRDPIEMGNEDCARRDRLDATTGLGMGLPEGGA